MGAVCFLGRYFWRINWKKARMKSKRVRGGSSMWKIVTRGGRQNGPSIMLEVSQVWLWAPLILALGRQTEAGGSLSARPSWNRVVSACLQKQSLVGWQWWRTPYNPSSTREVETGGLRREFQDRLQSCRKPCCQNQTKVENKVMSSGG